MLAIGDKLAHMVRIEQRQTVQVSNGLGGIWRGARYSAELCERSGLSNFMIEAAVFLPVVLELAAWEKTGKEMGYQLGGLHGKLGPSEFYQRLGRLDRAKVIACNAALADIENTQVSSSNLIRTLRKLAKENPLYFLVHEPVFREAGEFERYLGVFKPIQGEQVTLMIENGHNENSFEISVETAQRFVDAGLESVKVAYDFSHRLLQLGCTYPFNNREINSHSKQILTDLRDPLIGLIHGEFGRKAPDKLNPSTVFKETCLGDAVKLANDRDLSRTAELQSGPFGESEEDAINWLTSLWPTLAEAQFISEVNLLS